MKPPRRIPSYATHEAAARRQPKAKPNPVASLPPLDAADLDCAMELWLLLMRTGPLPLHRLAETSDYPESTLRRVVSGHPNYLRLRGGLGFVVEAVPDAT